MYKSKGFWRFSLTLKRRQSNEKIQYLYCTVSFTVSRDDRTIKNLAFPSKRCTSNEKRIIVTHFRMKIIVHTRTSTVIRKIYLLKNLISCSNLMHSLFIFFIFLYMFRAILCSSWGGSIVYTQHLVLYMSLFLCDRSVHRQLESSNYLCTERSPKKSDI